MNEDKLKIAIINFMWIAHYNGYLEEVNDIYEALKNPTHCIKRPDKWREKGNYGIDEFEGVFWSWLVMMFGDYGTSPRFGWIENKNSEYLISVFDEFKSDCDFTNKDEW